MKNKEKKLLKIEIGDDKLNKKYLDIMGVIIVVLDVKGKIILLNKKSCSVFGYKAKELIGKNWFDKCLPKDQRTQTKKVFSKIIKGKIKQLKYYENPIVTKRGEKRQIRWYNNIIRNNNKKIIGILSSGEDITDIKKIKEKLEESEKKYRRLFESAKDSILILDAESGKIDDCNPFVQDLLGYSLKELIGKKIYEISPFKDIVKNKEKFLELQKKGYVYYSNLPLQTKFGILKQVEFVSNVYMVNNKKVIQCNIRDITERIKKERELEKAKNEFLTLTSHQLRTPLSAIKWILETLIHDQGFFTLKQRGKLKDLVVSNERLINLVNKLLEITRIDSGKLVIKKKFVDLKKLINDLSLMFKLLAAAKKKNIKIIIPSNLKNVYCDPVLISSAIENFLSNALNYSSVNSKLITIKVVDRISDYLISVHNDGVIDSLSVKRIKHFDKFIRGVYASEKQPSGSGLGLYFTKKIIEANGGTVWFKSSIKSGTTFYLTIIKK